MKPWLSNLLLGTILLFAQSLLGKGELQPLYHYGMGEGLPSERVYWTMQDDLGYMWFATQAGVCQYDGYRAKVLTTSQGLSHNQVRELYADEQNRIWMLTQNGLSRKSGESLIRLDSLKRIGPVPISSIIQISTDEYWLTTHRMLHIIKGDTVFQTKRLQSYGLLPNAELVFVDAETIWLADAKKLLGVGLDLKERKQIPFTYRGVKPAQIPLFVAIGQGEYLSPTQAGLVSIKIDGTQTLVSSAKDFTNWGPARDIKQDEQGDIWIAFESGGVLWLTHENESYREIDCLLKEESIWHLFEDREGNLWITTDESGVWLFTAGAKRLYRYNLVEHKELHAFQQNNPSNLADISIDNEKGIWFAWENGRLLRLKNLHSLKTASETETFNLSRQLGNGEHIRHILGLNEGGLMIATETSLWYFDKDRMTVIPLENAPISISQLDNGDIYVGTDAVVGQKGQLSDYLKPKPSLSPVFAVGLSAVVEDYQQSVLLAWMSGVSIIKDGRDSPLKPNEEIFRSGVNDLATCSDSTLWFATNGSGLLIQHPDGATSVLNKSLGMRNEVCNTVSVDEYGDLAWVGTQNGMGWISRRNKMEEPKLRWLDQRDGLAGNWVEQILRYDQHLLIRSKEGFTIMEPYYEFPSALAAPVYITDVFANGKKLTLDKQFYAFPADSNNIELQFTGLGFRYP
ncbi:MAG: two-component regulator propeller domain-containing protein, partial [Bacteroidia bacterium]